jgi:hypothetical protein
MDIHVKARVDRRFQAQAPPLSKTIKFEGWSYWIDEAKMHDDKPSRSFLYQIHKAPMKDFLSQPDHLRMTEAGFDLVDWWSVKRALDSFPVLWSWLDATEVWFLGPLQMPMLPRQQEMRSHLMCFCVKVRVQTQNGRIGYCTLGFGCLKLTHTP